MKFFTTKKILSWKIAVAALVLGLIFMQSIAQEKSQFLSLKEAIEVAVSSNSAMQSGKIEFFNH